jgi:regulator of replication initiation timing
MTVKAGRTLDLEPLERLEGKLRKLVTLVEQLRTEKSALVDENTRLQVQLESAQAKLADAEQASNAELVALRHERDHVRERVAGLLEQLDALEV